MNEQIKEKLRQNLWYVIIAILCLGVLLVFPFLRSYYDMGFDFPTTSWGWVLFWFEKVSMTAINMTIFTAFKKQGKLNIKDDEKFKEANEILNKARSKKYKPLSPGQYQARSYSKKGTTLVISTMATLVCVTNMILRFDYLALISYAITLVMAVIFGIFAMQNDEVYWTNDYYYWALKQATEAQISPVSREDDPAIHAIGPQQENSIQGEI